MREISPPLGFDPRNVQPVASRYTADYATLLTLLEKLTGFQQVKKFPAFYETRRFITAYTKDHTCPYPEIDQSSPSPLIPLPEDPS